MSKKVISLNSSDFEETVRTAKKKIFVDFWAPWCKPCLSMDPMIERLAERHDSTMIFAKVNVEECQDIAMKYNVSSIPTFLILDKSSPRSSRIGAMTETELESLVSR